VKEKDHVSRTIIILAAIAAIFGIASGAPAVESPKEGLSVAPRTLLAFVGTYTDGKSKGIYSFRFDLASGKAAAPVLAAESESPSFLAVHPGGRFLYAANEIFRPGGGMASAFAVDPGKGTLSLLNRESSAGTGPCHLSVDATGKVLLVANYGDGIVAALPIGPDGRLGAASARIAHAGSGPDAERQKGPHAHCVTIDPANRFVVAADLGIDRLIAYRLDPARGALERAWEARLRPGAGPRHFAFDPAGRFGYSIEELACTITSYSYDAEKGALKEIGTVSTLPGARERDFSTAEIAVHPSGKFLYGSNRGHGSIAAFRIEPSGLPVLIEHRPTGGKTPRGFEIDPTGTFLLAANQDADSIHVFRIDPAKGTLAPAGEEIRIPAPVCVKFLAVP
jgi:6-phosphogluconolactonase